MSMPCSLRTTRQLFHRVALAAGRFSWSTERNQAVNISQAISVTTPTRRTLCSDGTTTNADKTMTMEDVNDLFAEARMSLQDATESKGTVYFEDDFNDAKQITQDSLEAFDKVCASATPEQRQSLLDANRPKMAQLKEEFKNLEDELIHDDH